MISLRLFQEVPVIVEEAREIAIVEFENPHSINIKSQTIAGRFIFSEKNEDFEFRFYDLALNEDFKIIRAKSSDSKWYLSAVYGNAKLHERAMASKIAKGAIALVEMHNLMKDDEVIFKAPCQLMGCTIRMSEHFLRDLTSNNEASSFPFTVATGHVAISQHLDHEMYSIIKKNFRIPVSSFLFLRRTENLAYEIAYDFLEKLYHRMNNLQTTAYSDIYLQKMLHANSLFSDFTHPPSLKDISRFVGLGPGKANELFKQVYGMTPNRYFNDKRMKEAYDLLMAGKYNISEIGAFVGFANMSHFSKAFKKHFGILPKKMQLHR